ncbi:MAG: cysteine desulfurase family protein [Anaerolineaceae bacterium]
MKTPIYLDYNATTPIDKRVADAMLPYLYDVFGNPSSSHPYGVQAKLVLETARRRLASMLRALPDEIIFTGGGTESNNLAIRGYCLKNRLKGNHIITSAIEHPAVLDVCSSLVEVGFELTILPVDQYGMVNPQDLYSALRSDTILVSIMHANNEVGTIQPIQELTRITHQAGAAFHCDAAQSVGKISVDVDEMGVDLLSVAGHKLYAPKGVGALYIRTGIQIEKITQGAGHERNLRPGTENVLEIAGLGKAAEIVMQDLNNNNYHFQEMRDRLQLGIITNVGGDTSRVNGHPSLRLPNTLSISFFNQQANVLLSRISAQVAASAGAACHADQINISNVLAAMNVPVEWAMGTLRFSVGRETTMEEIDFAIQIISQIVKKIY